MLVFGCARREAKASVLFFLFFTVVTATIQNDLNDIVVECFTQQANLGLGAHTIHHRLNREGTLLVTRHHSDGRCQVHDQDQSLFIIAVVQQRYFFYFYFFNVSDSIIIIITIFIIYLKNLRWRSAQSCPS